MFFGSIACGLGAERENFRIGEDARRLFGGVKDARHRGLVSGDAVLLQPEQHVGFSAHRADLDDLVEAEKMRGHTTVDGVGKLEIIEIGPMRSEEHTSELQSHLNLVCRLLLEKKKNK